MARFPSISPAEKERLTGLLFAAAGVAAAFVFAIGTGYRVTNTPDSPIGDGLYFSAIAVLVLVVVLAVRHFWGPKGSERPAAVFWSDAAPPSPPPSLEEFAELQSRIESLAQLINAPAYVMPTYGISHQSGLPHIEIDGATYHYVVCDRGQEFERSSTTSIDELLYWVFRAVTYSMARPPQKPGQDYRREIFKEQLALLERLNPEWSSRCAAEHQEALVRYPFIDEA